jgi:putative transposase
MPRPLRCFEAGIYHVGSHGSDTRRLFLGDSDRSDFVERLGFTFWQRGIELLAYVLLGNHYHTLVRIPDARLSEGLQRLHTEYSRQHNRRHGHSAHLFRAHCFARRIRDDDQLLTAYRYLALNPVAAGLVLDPLDWPWSSAAAHAGVRPAPVPLQQEPLRSALGDGPRWQERYRELIRPEEQKARRSGPPPVAGARYGPISDRQVTGASAFSWPN